MPLKLRNVGVETSFGKQHGDFCASSAGMAILFVDHLVPSLHLGPRGGRGSSPKPRTLRATSLQSGAIEFESRSRPRWT
jgi:hypothetical protein